MKIDIEKQKLIEMLKKLSVNGIFKSADIAIDNGRINSNQVDDTNNILRIATFKQSYFEVIEGSDRFLIDINNFLTTIEKRLKNLKSNEIVTIEKKNSELSVSDSFTIKTYPIISEIPPYKLSFEKDIPKLSNCELLDTHLTINRNDLISSTRNLKSRDTLSFYIKDGILIIVDKKRGDMSPKHKLINGDELKVTFDHDITNIVESFTKNKIQVYSKTEKPTWFSETADDYAFGVLIQSVEDKQPSIVKDTSIYQRIITVGRKMGGTRGGEIQLEGKDAFLTNTKRSSLYKFELKDDIGTGTFYAKQALPQAVEVKCNGKKVLFKTFDGVDKDTTYLPNIKPFDKDSEEAFIRDYFECKISVPVELFDKLKSDIFVTKIKIRDWNLILKQTRSDGSVGFESVFPLYKDLLGTEITNTDEIAISTNDLLIIKPIIEGTVFFGFKKDKSLSVFVPFSGGELKALIGNLTYD